MAKTFFLSLILILIPVASESSKTDEAPLSWKMRHNFTAESNESTNFSSSGGSGIAISGEPAHIGDSLRASVLVSNSGNSSGSVSLKLANLANVESFEGAPVNISPGSTREVSVYFSPSSNGSNSYRWWISSFEGPDPESLEGEFSVDALPNQILDATIESFQWGDDGLILDASVHLSSGLSRNLLVQVSVGTQGSISLLQSIIVEADPGRRPLEFHLGQPIADSVYIEAIPTGWTLAEESANSSQISVDMPSVTSSALMVESSFVPSKPTPGDKVIATISLTNGDNFHTKDGSVRVILSSDKTILAETSVQSIIPGGTISSDVSIPSWPEGERVELEVHWSAGGVTATSYLSIDSNVADEGMAFPFDVVSAAYGVLVGILAILVGTLAWRAVTTRTPTTSELGLRDTKEATEARSRIKKSEISCTFCEQRLMIPSNHSGGVRCPSCSMEFRVGEEETTLGEEETTPEPLISRSSEDNLNCPECDQTLRVPIEKRPAISRCPVCKTEFLAETEGV
tara:strand:+ start:3518 stop:5062 length:1545 start_codon:yes stop_codon:yes gene_type:complete